MKMTKAQQPVEKLLADITVEVKACRKEGKKARRAKWSNIVNLFYQTLTKLCITFVSVHTTGTLKKGMLSRTMWSIPTPRAYVNQMPRLFITRVLGFTSLWATPTFILLFCGWEERYRQRETLVILLLIKTKIVISSIKQFAHLYKGQWLQQLYSTSQDIIIYYSLESYLTVWTVLIYSVSLKTWRVHKMFCDHTIVSFI